MSNYPNGQPHYNYPQTSQYGSPAQGQSGLHRNSSFDAGDDHRFFDLAQQQAHAAAGYPTHGSHGTQQHPSTSNSSASHHSTLPLRSNTQSYTVGGYQYQPSQPQNYQYNPAQYQHQQSPTQYHNPAYSSPQTYQGATYQPYIPAVYGDAALNRHGSLYNNQYATNQAGYAQTPAAPPPPPPPPPRPSDYGQQGYGNSAYHQDPLTARHSSYGGYASSAYVPNSPPAPPPPPHHETSSTARPYSQGYSTNRNSTIHSPQHQGATLSAQTSPDIHRQYSGASRVSEQSSSFANSPQPSIPTPPSRNTSHQSPQRSNTLDRHPQGRTLPGLPSESESDTDYFHSHRSAGATTSPGYADLMSHLNAAISDTRATNFTQDVMQSTDPLFDSSARLSPDEKPTHINGIVAAGDSNINYGAFTHDSDAEAAAGLAAMQAADEQEAAEEARRQSGTIQSIASQASSPWKERSDDSDYAGYDLSLAGGGFSTNMSYGAQYSSAGYPSGYGQQGASEGTRDSGDRLHPRMNSVRSTGVSSDGRTSQTSGLDESEPIRTDVARVDTGGTGGLTTPSAHRHRRMSYDDGDESDLVAAADGGPMQDIPDLFFHPGMSPNRPLPPPPSHSDPGRVPRIEPTSSLYQNRNSQYDQIPRLLPGITAFNNRSQSPLSSVPRSSSMATNRSVPKPDQPMRSKTDADRQRYARQQANQQFEDIYEISSPTSIGIDLPSLPRKKFNPAKISPEQFKRCSEPWALSSILSWIRDLAEEETDLREHAVAQGITFLFMSKVPTMNTTEAEVLGEKVVKQMLEAGALIKDEEWVKFGPGVTSGVLYQLTGRGCYSSKLHVYSSKGRCYSHFCMRTLKKVDLSVQSEKKSDDWATYYKLKKEDWEGRDKKEVERQNVLHEVVTGEDNYMVTLDVLRVLYRDALQNAQPPIMPGKKLPAFLRDVFGVVDKIKKVNEDFLLPQLKYRQNEQGPWIVGFSDIFREWIRRARAVYVEYASALPMADYLVRREQERNLLFKQFVDQVSNDPRSSRLPIDNFLKSPMTRLQRYGLLLQTALKLMLKDSDERSNLVYALDEVRAATFECNAKVEEFQKKTSLIELQRKLKLRKGMEVVELNLDHLGRQIIMRGDLQRAGGRGFQMVDTHAILFDHYMVLAKSIVTKDSTGGAKQEQYDVSKSPIPMDLISIESTNDAPVVKSSVKGIATVTTTVAPRGQPTPDPRLVRTQSTASGGSLQHTTTGLSSNSGTTAPSLVPTTALDGKEDKLLYPFRVKHLGKVETYILYTNTSEKRQEWCDAIISAKEAHAEALFEQNAEPFKLRVLADTAFGYESYAAATKRVLIRGTPLHRAIQESEKRYTGLGRPAPVCRALVNCATVFQQPYGRHMCAIGTDYGVYITEYNNPRGWVRSIQSNRVTQVAVLEEFNLFLVISDKVLIAHHLDVVCPASGPLIAAPTDATMRKAPQRLSGAKDVGFFYTAKMKDRILVFYKKRDGITSTFKVLEPVLQKAATSRSRFLPSSSRRGQTDFFRDYDEFYIPAECYGMNVFNTTVAISTARGVEVLILDKKQPWSVPNLRSETAETQAHLSSIATRIKDLKPLGMFRLSDAEFLVTFEECAVYVNKHGDISRGVVMEFVGRAKAACLHEQYLILCDDDFVEIRDAQNGRLKQVIAGKDMKLLDDGGNVMPGQGRPSEAIASLGGGLNGLAMQMGNKRTVKLCMQHPENEKSFVIVELLLGGEKN